MNNLIEHWKEVPEQGGRYEVSDKGRVLSNFFLEPRVLIPRVSSTGHLHARFYSHDSQLSPRICDLVLTCFVGPCPPLHDCKHVNGDVTDNRLDNLKWVYVGPVLCKRGHEIMAPNLKVGGGCLACDRARASLRRHPELDLQTESDRHYLKIMAGGVK